MSTMVDQLLKTIADLDAAPFGAYNLRSNGAGAGRRSTENVVIESKKDRPGIDITVRPGTKGETVYIPVVVTTPGLNDLVYNDFYIGEGADVLIVAGCGIHNDGCEDSRHDGVHRFFIGKNARLRYVEKHYGEGAGSGGRILNPTTEVTMEEGSSCEMEMVQIAGVDSTVRETSARLGKDAHMLVTERLMTHGKQTAHSNMTVSLDGEGSSVQIVSRSVGRDDSEQVFHPNAVGNAACRAHIQCDSILMDRSKISSIPQITANHPDAQIIHEAAIGRINNEQLLKLETLGMTEEESETIIVEAFLS